MSACFFFDWGRDGIAKFKVAKSQRGKFSCWMLLRQVNQVTWSFSTIDRFIMFVGEQHLLSKLTVSFGANARLEAKFGCVRPRCCGCLTAYCLALDICREFSRLPGWWFEPCETFKAPELNKKKDLPKSCWMIYWHLPELFLSPQPEPAETDCGRGSLRSVIAESESTCRLKFGALGVGMCRKGGKKSHVATENK